MRIEGYAEKRSQLVSRLKTLTGDQVIYNGPPDFSHEIGPYKVNRDGSMVVLDDNADEDVLEELYRGHLLKKPETPSSIGDSGAEQVEHPRPGSRACVANSGPASPSELRPADWSYSIVREEAADDSGSGPIVIRDQALSVRTMINLINMIYSKGDMLSRSVGRINSFWVSTEVIERLSYERPENFRQLAGILGVQDRLGLIKGIAFTEDSVTFIGFPETNDFVLRMTYEQLAKAMYRQAVEKQKISTRRMQVENEKYFFRNWLNRLGFTGSENKTYRDILLKNLDGNTAYRTNSQFLAYKTRKQNKYWEEKRKEQLQAARAAREAEATETRSRVEARAEAMAGAF